MKPRHLFGTLCAVIAVVWLGGTVFKLWESVSSVSDLQVPSKPDAQSLEADTVLVASEIRAESAGEEFAQDPALLSTPIRSTAAEVPIYQSTWESGIDRATGATLYATFEEVERGENFSYFETSLGDVDSLIARFEEHPPPNVWDVVSQAIGPRHAGPITELACLRGFEHWIAVGERGMSGFYVFLTNDETIPIRELLGDMYSEGAQRYFDTVGYGLAPRQNSIIGPRGCFINDSSSFFYKYQQDCPEFVRSTPAHCKAVRPLDVYP